MLPSSIINKSQENLKIKIIEYTYNSFTNKKSSKFNFWNVDEELNNEINKYISSYSGKNKEILDL